MAAEVGKSIKAAPAVQPLRFPVFKPARRSAILPSRSLLALAAVALVATGCRGSAAAFGPTPTAAAATADRFLAAFAVRFTNVTRTPKFYEARSKLARSALTPSRLFGDTSLWTATGPTGRTLAVQGSFAGNRYTLDARPNPAPPTRVGDTRHVMHLERLGDGQYEWTTAVDLAAGEVTGDQLGALLVGVLATAAGRGDDALRAETHAAFPRGAAALGRLFSIDSVHGVPGADGASLVTLAVSLHPDRLRATYPAFAAYVEKYVQPSRYKFVLRDRSGARWFDAAARDNRLTVRLRTVGGRLAPMDGALRAMPADLVLTAEMFVKISVFTVGVSDLRADFTMIRTPHERGWNLHFHDDPDWHLPLAAARLLRSPLGRPFEGAGSVLRITVRDSAGAQTLLTRRVRVPVQESAIVRWLGGLGGSAAGDFAGKSEAEENRFQADAFNALREDIRSSAARYSAASP